MHDTPVDERAIRRNAAHDIHNEGLAIWECPCTECLHLDFEASFEGLDDQPSLAEFIKRERVARIP